MQLNLLKTKQVNKHYHLKMQDGENIMVILSSPSGVGKTTINKKNSTKISIF